MPSHTLWRAAFAAGVVVCAAGAASGQAAFEAATPYQEQLSASAKVTDARVMAIMERALFERGFDAIKSGVAVRAAGAGALCLQVQSRDGNYRGWQTLRAGGARWGAIAIPTKESGALSAYRGEGVAVAAIAGPACGPSGVTASETAATVLPVASSEAPKTDAFVLIVHTSGRGAELVVYNGEEEEAYGDCVAVDGGAGVAYDRKCALPAESFLDGRETFVFIQQADGQWTQDQSVSVARF